MSAQKNVEIDAILGEEFDRLLERLEVKEEFEAGTYHCHICGDQVRADNVLLVLPLSENEVGFICRKPECIIKYKSNP